MNNRIALSVSRVDEKHIMYLKLGYNTPKDLSYLHKKATKLTDLITITEKGLEIKKSCKSILN